MRRGALMMLSTTCAYACGAAPPEAPVVVAIAPAPAAASAAPKAAPANPAAEIENALAKVDGIPIASLHGDSRGSPVSEIDISSLVLHTGDGLHLGPSGGGPVTPGRSTGGLAGIGGSPAPLDKPIGVAMVGSPMWVKGSVANGGAVIAGFRAGLRHCYDEGLLTDATMVGRVEITATIAPSGEVLTAVATKSSGLSATVIACVAARVSAAQFAVPDGGAATVIIPVTFVRGN
jgi:hypothetical protein